MMGNAPDRIWFTPWDEGEENGTAGPASHTGGKPPNGDATEYVLNTPEAMRKAGYVPEKAITITAENYHEHVPPVSDPSKESVSMRDYLIVLNSAADLRAELTRTQQQLGTAQKEAKAFYGNATDNYNHFLQAADNISQLKLQLATARNDALEEAAQWHDRQRYMLQDLVDQDDSIGAEPLRKALYSTTISEHDSATKAIRAMKETGE